MTQININAYVNSNLQKYSNGTDYPLGGTSLTIGGIGFTLGTITGGGTGVIQAPAQAKPSVFDVSVNVANPTIVYALINSTYGVYGDTVGSVEFKATGGLDATVNLVEGQDIRDHNNYEFNNTIGRGALGGIYLGTASFGGGQVRLDKLGFALPSSFQSATLTDIILHGTGDYPTGNPFLAAATVVTGSSISQPTLTALRASAASAAIGQSVTFTATVSDLSPGGDLPNGGTVTFSNHGVVIGTGTLTNGVAAFTTSSLAAGTATVTASYGGTTNFAPSATGTIATIVGNGTQGNTGNGGPATAAELNDPHEVVFDPLGDLFLVDSGNNEIREVVKATGNIITVAGNGTAGFKGDNGLATSAELYNPIGIAIDPAGDLYVGDNGNDRIREVVKATGDIVTVAGTGVVGFSGDNGLATSAKISAPLDVALDPAGDLFFSDNGNNRIREVVKATGNIITVAGNGTAGFSGDNGLATSAEINSPRGPALDSLGDLFIVDNGNKRIREVVKATGKIITIAGNGIAGFSGNNGLATLAELNDPLGVILDPVGDVFIADDANNVVREVVKATGNIVTVAGNGIAGFSGDNGPATAAEINSANRVAIDPAGDLFLSDWDNNRIREVTPAVTVTIGPSIAFSTVTAVSVSTTSTSFGQAITFTATVTNLSAGGAIPTGGTVTFSNQGGVIGSGTLVGGLASLTISSLGSGTASVTASYGGTANFAPSASGTIAAAIGNGTAGDTGDTGPATAAELDQPIGLCFDASGNLFIADYVNNVVREVVKATGIIITVAGNGIAGYSGDTGPATAAELNGPDGVVVDSAGDLFISENFNHTVREVVKASGIITTVAGNGTAGFTGNNGLATSSELHNPHGLAIDSVGNLFIADSYNAEIREVVKATGLIIDVAGNGTYGYGGDNGPATSGELAYPFDVNLDQAGDLFIADTANNRIREVIKATGKIATVAGNGTAGDTGDNGPPTSAELHLPYDVVVDSAGNLFLVDNGNDAIREVIKATGTIVTIAGNGTIGDTGDGGPATAAEFNNPGRLAIDPAGDLFLSDTNNNVVREITPAMTVIISVSTRVSPTITWPDPTAITYGTVLGSTQLDATASFDGSTVAGTFTYSVVAGTILNAGTQTLAVTFHPTDTADYQATSAQATLVVNKATPTITWPNPTAITYGTPLGGTQLDATASVPGTFTYTPAAGTVLLASQSQALLVTFTPADSSDNNSVTASASINVLVATTTSLAISSMTAALHRPIQLSATVSAVGGSSTPTGSVTFFDGSNPIGSATLDATGLASMVLSTLGPGPHALTATYNGNTSDSTSRSTTVPFRVGDAVAGDYDGDGKADLAIYDQTTSTFFIQKSTGGTISLPYGNPAHLNVPVTGDFDGDGKTDIAIYDQTAATFYVLESGGGSIALPYGNPKDVNIPVAGDFDGDGKTDIAIYDRTLAKFFVLQSGGGSIALPYGNPKDVNIPVAGDYDGDGKTDIAIYDQALAEFYVLKSGGGSIALPYGNPKDVNIPLASDFDGDGKTDIAIDDQSAATFYAVKSGGGRLTMSFGNPAVVNLPLASDFDGDGKTDIALYDSTDAVFYVLYSENATGLTLQFGNKKHTNLPISS